MPNNVKAFIKKYGTYYAIGLLIVFALKYHYSNASSDDLGWILAPTAWWVRILSGIPFERELNIGYISHTHRFIIAPSCAGVNFMIIAFSTLLFTFTHHMSSVRKRFLWIPVSLGLSYIFTVLVNGLRIIASIYLFGLKIYNGWVTPERVHMIEGTIIYFVSLLIMYSIVNKVINIKHPAGSLMKIIRRCLPPLFSYFSVTIGIPLINRAYENNGIKFLEHSVLVISVCSTSILLFCLAFIVNRFFKNKKLHRQFY